jgi:PAS domain-containing protein
LPLEAQQKIRSLEAEVMVTSLAGTTAPYPIWQIDKAGEVCWHNNAYGHLYQRIFEKDPSVIQPLFDIEAQTSNPLQSRRTSISSAIDEKQLWYDISCVESDSGIICHAIDINAVIAQRNFVQTLAKTFAHLSTGLAIFDRNGQLALFNPALVDLSKLPVEFLSTRPDLLSFFDRLRDNQVMPEPKNYHS